MCILRYFLLILLIVFLSCSDKITKEEDFNRLDENVIKIGYLGPYSYELSDGDTYYYEALLAIRQANLAGGIMGKKLALIPEDTKTNPDTAIVAAKKLLDKGVVAIIGPITSTNTIAVSTNVTIPNNILLITPWATSPAIANIEDNNLVWRTVPSDNFQGVAAANYILTKLNKKTCSVIYIDNDYGEGLANIFKKTYTENGGQIYKILKYSQNIIYNEDEQRKLPVKIDSLFSDLPEIIYFVTYDYDGAYILNRIFESGIIEQNYNPVFFGCDGNTKDAFISNVVSFFDVDFYTTMVAPLDSAGYFDKFRNDFEKILEYRFSLQNSGNVYDAASLLIYTLAASPSLNTQDIVETIPEIANNGGEKIFYNEFEKGLSLIAENKKIDYEGVFNPLDFDENGDIKKAAYFISKIENKDFIVIDTIIVE